jgi:hypothetical protein
LDGRRPDKRSAYLAGLFESLRAPGYGSPRPDGPSLDLSTWREDPWVFITRAEAVFPDESPTVEVDGIRPLYHGQSAPTP